MNNTTVINWKPFDDAHTPKAGMTIMVSYKLNGEYTFGMGHWHPLLFNGIPLQTIGGGVLLHGRFTEDDSIVILGWDDLPESYHPAIEYAPAKDNKLGLIYYKGGQVSPISRYMTLYNYVVITDGNTDMKFRVCQNSYCDAHFYLENVVPYDMGPEGISHVIATFDADHLIDHIELWTDPEDYEND